MDISTHITAWREQEPRPYRATLVHLLALASADEAGVWEPATKAGLLRALAHRGQTEATRKEAVLAIRHAVALGVLRTDSTTDRLVLTGSGAPYPTAA